MAAAGDRAYRKPWSASYAGRPKFRQTDTPSYVWGYGRAIAISAGIGIISHPLNQAKFLIQVGHEPIEPRLCNNFFGTPVLLLPNVFKYARHIKQRDGWSGCFRGCTEGVCSQVASMLTQNVVDNWLASADPEEEEDASAGAEDIYRPEDSKPKQESHSGLFRRVTKQVISRSAAVIVSQPFHVIMCRTMVQFVGREVRYTGIFTSFREVYKGEGVSGFFSGLVPRLICEISTLVLAEYAKYWVARLVKDESFRAISPYLCQMVVSSFTYPYTVVANCMAVNDCGLAGGMPPHMPVYGSWTDCYAHLKRIGQMSRGGSFGNRYYAKGPTAIILASSMKHGSAANN